MTANVNEEDYGYRMLHYYCTRIPPYRMPHRHSFTLSKRGALLEPSQPTSLRAYV